MPVTIQDIARELNISHTTVSRVLNNNGAQFISAATRDRVLETAREMGYRRNQAARALVTGRTNQIALWMRHLYTAFHAEVVHEVEKQLGAAGYQMTVATLNDQTPQEAFAPAQWHVDGYLAFENASRAQALIQGSADGRGRSSQRPPRIPIVGMGGRDFGGEDMDCVGFDLYAGARAALTHLMGVGCKRIVYIGPVVPTDPRPVAYDALMAEAGRPPEHLYTPNQEREEVRAMMRAFITEKGCPDGLFCLNDEIAIAVYAALRDLGRRVPEDAALIGCDGILETQYVDPPLSTVALPIPEMCARAWEILQLRIQNPDLPPQRIMLPPQLIIRASTRR